MSSSLPKVLIVSTGGTITMTAGAGSGLTPTLSADDLLAAVPALQECAQLETLTFSTVPGASLSLEGLVELANVLNHRLALDIDGAVVIQGTDTIEETAFLLDLLLDSDKPVVVTGAMRGASQAGADGPANLLAAVITVGTPQACSRSVMVVLNDQIHSALTVQKSHTGFTSAFSSPSTGPVGMVCEGQAVFYYPALTRRQRFPQTERLAPVAIVKASLGESAALLESAAELGYEGIVIEAMGAGHLPQDWADSVEKIAARLPVVLAVRTAAGAVFTRTYGFKGSEIDLIARGVIPAGLLDPLKARLLLATILPRGTDRQAIGAAFQHYMTSQ